MGVGDGVGVGVGSITVTYSAKPPSGPNRSETVKPSASSVAKTFSIRACAIVDSCARKAVGTSTRLAYGNTNGFSSVPSPATGSLKSGAAGLGSSAVTAKEIVSSGFASIKISLLGATSSAKNVRILSLASCVNERRNSAGTGSPSAIV